MLYLRVPDIGAAHATLQARGVSFTHAPHLIHRHADGTEEWMAFFEDPDSRPMAIICQKKQPRLNIIVRSMQANTYACESRHGFFP